MILADTSVWIEHLRVGSAELAARLVHGEIVVHSFVIGELACGTLPHRHEVLDLLGRLPAAIQATDAEVLAFIERAELPGRGIGYVDAHLLASARLGHDTRLWTRDRRLAAVAVELHLAHALS